MSRLCKYALLKKGLTPLLPLLLDPFIAHIHYADIGAFNRV